MRENKLADPIELLIQGRAHDLGGFLWSLHFVDKARAEREAAEADSEPATPMVALGTADDGPVAEDGAAARPAAA